MTRSPENSLYLDGEERFGRLGALVYSHLEIGCLRELHEYAVVELLEEVTPNMSVLDIGTGTGTVPNALAKEMPAANFYGVDPSIHMIRRAQEQADMNGLSNVHFMVGNSRNLPGTKFDLIFSCISLHHWKEKTTSLSNIHTHLIGEKFLVFEFNRSKMSGLLRLFRNHAMRGRDFLELQKSSQFRSVTIEEGEDGKFVKASLLR